MYFMQNFNSQYAHSTSIKRQLNFPFLFFETICCFNVCESSVDITGCLTDDDFDDVLLTLIFRDFDCCNVSC